MSGSSKLTNFPWRSGITGRKRSIKRLWKPMEKMPRILIGIGNPGPEYDNIRHNVGRNFTQFFTNKMNLNFQMNTEMNNNYDCEMCYFQDAKLLILKPMRFMNMYGPVLAQILNDFNLNIDDCCVAYDCFYTKFGHWQLRNNSKRSSGHPALTSIMEHCGRDFWRIQIGIGRPSNIQLLSKYIINPFTIKEQQILNSNVFDSILFHLCNSLLAHSNHIPLTAYSLKNDPELRFYKNYILTDFNSYGEYSFRSAIDEESEEKVNEKKRNDIHIQNVGYWPGSLSYDTILDSNIVQNAEDDVF